MVFFWFRLGTDGINGLFPPISNISVDSVLLWTEQGFNYYTLANVSSDYEFEFGNITQQTLIYLVEGKGAFKPGHGGNGGVGGIGGNAGDLLIFGLDETPQFNISTEAGQFKINTTILYWF